MRKKKISLTLLRRLAAESIFNPNESKHPLTIIVENHCDDPGYLESRSIEMIAEAKLAGANKQFDVYHEKMQKAISLSLLARASRQLLEDK